MAAVSTFARFEAVCAGLIAFGTEVQIWYTLALDDRALYYYHLIPVASGALLVADGAWPGNPSVSLAATLVNACTALNVYNTYFLHVVAIHEYVVPASDDDLLRDLFLPRYVDEFYPWGPVTQLLYSLIILVHCVYRCHVTSRVLTNS